MATVLSPVLTILTRFFIIPLYKIAVINRIRLQKWFASARGSVFLIFTNRYVFHAVLLLISGMTISAQLQTKHANASSVGRQSVLYALVTGEQDELTEENIHLESTSKNANYLGEETLRALPSIDYDYEEESIIADIGLPGAISVPEGANLPGIPEQQLARVRTETEKHIVASGETIAAIARQYGVDVGTILWANGLDKRGFIKPGLALKIPAVSGVLHRVKKGDTIDKLARVYDIATERIIAANHLDDSRALSIGDELTIPGGTPPEPPRSLAKPRTIAIRPNVSISRIRNKSYDDYQELTKPDTRLKPADLPETDVATPKRKLLWPTRLHAINQYYGWRHTGVDIDGDYTDPIYASADGVVEKSGWNNSGYGLQIVVDHQNGLKTRYAHASKLFVQPGDMVKRGQVIAMVGTTGRSTGTHLHYEVFHNGRRQNPLAYVR